jgi:4-hydroxy-4-methyl-2-oxoglutarate aldolase
VIAALRKITSPTVANAIETFNVRPRNQGYMSSELRALFPELGPLVGYAVTALIRAEPAPEDGHRASTFGYWDYIQAIPEPRVVVVHDLDEPRGQGSQWGEVQANIHKALGCAGAITDGSVRDLDEVRTLGFQFVAAHVSVSHAYVHVVDFGLPVKLGGLWVKPGDLLHADQHGVVTIPADLAPKIPDAVAKIEATERRIIGLCQSREFSAEGLKALYREIRPGTY